MNIGGWLGNAIEVPGAASRNDIAHDRKDSIHGNQTRRLAAFREGAF